MAAPQKTPISVLNEFALHMKLEIPGQYIDIEDPMGASTSDSVRCSPIFRYEYVCNGYVARGEGTAKKRAQHNAAEKMLSILKRSPEFSSAFRDITLSSPSDIKVDKDAVGPLLDFCVEYRIPTPEYQTVREEGPAHDRRFTSRCSVLSHEVEATDRIKKQAKQQVALQMHTILRNTIDPRVNREIRTEVNESHLHDFEEALKQFPNCQRSFNTKYHGEDLSSPLMSDFSRYREYFFSNVHQVIDEFAPQLGESPEKMLDAILQKIDIKYSLVPIRSDHCEDCIVVLNIQFAPDLNISEMGSSYVQASRKAAQKAINHIRILCTPLPKEKDNNSMGDKITNGESVSPEQST